MAVDRGRNADRTIVAAAVAAATAYFYWRRDILGTIVTGTAVLLVLKLGFGW